MSPIIIFKSYQQAYNCLRYYQELLGLQNWLIDIRLDYDADVVAPNWGASNIWRAMHIAEITIRMPKPEQINPFPARYCQEEIMVHECLHILLPTFEVDHDTNEGKFFESENHAKLEAIAKALIMAKYGLNINWFYNYK